MADFGADPALVPVASNPQAVSTEGFDPGDITIPSSVYNFLMGVDALDGVWFGELHDSLPGRFWWRGILASAAGWPTPSLHVANCETCGREFEIRPAPTTPWPNCLAPDCGSYDPARDLDGGGPEWDAVKDALTRIEAQSDATTKIGAARRARAGKAPKSSIGVGE